ncbi:MAG: transglycosylase family protein [Solirubrobacteraceae bacterium]
MSFAASPMSFNNRAAILRVLAATALISALLLLAAGHRTTASAATSSLSQLNSQLGQEQARQQSLNSSVSALAGLISSLDGQIALVQNREAAVRAQLATERSDLARVQASLRRERILVGKLRRRLAWARMLLSRQLVSGYEGDRPDLVSVVLDAHGFNDLLEQVAFLGQAQRQQQTIISFTKAAKRQADRAISRLAKLESSERQITQATTLRARALQGMNSLLQSKQAALQRARYAQQLALQASQSRAHQLQSSISRIHAQQLAAQRAAAAAAAAQRAAAATQPAPTVPTAPTAPSTSAPVSSAPSGGWAIPYAIVLCESGGQNLPPNSAGASGYYQIIPATWRLFGGSGPAAYLASKSEQDAIASRIWNGGAGASNWVCAGIVGIH